MRRLKLLTEDHDIIAKQQTGFGENMSTSNSSMEVIHKIKWRLNDKRNTLAVLVDF